MPALARTALLAAATSLPCFSCGTLTAQQTVEVPESTAALEQLVPLRWFVDAEGRTVVRPDPFGEHAERLLFHPPFGDGSWIGNAAMNGGAFLWLTMVCPGDADLASLTDARHHFARLGLDSSEQGLGERIGREVALVPDPIARRRAELDRLLAIRVAAADGRATLVPALEALVGQESLDAITRRAAHEAIASLRGSAPPRWEHELADWRALLAELPAQTDVLTVIHMDAMPDMSTMLATGRQILLESQLAELQAAGRPVDPGQLRASMTIGELAPELPYELARVYGNVRLRRAVFAAAGGMEATSSVAILDGLFEVHRLQEGLTADGIPAELRDGCLTFALEGTRGTVTATRAVLRSGDEELLAGGAPRDGDDLGARLRGARPTPDDSYWMWLAHPSELAPDLPLLQGAVGPATARLRLNDARGRGLTFELRLPYDSERAAKLGQNGMRALPGMARMALPGEARELFDEFLDAFEVERDETTVRARLVLPEFDLVAWAVSTTRDAMQLGR